MTVAGLFAGAATRIWPYLPSAHAAEKAGLGNKALIVYYSRSGNTREIANQIHGLVASDIVELQTVDPYPAEYEATTKQAKDELNRGYKPPLKTKIEGMESYGVIILGSPNWWGTLASPVRTFLSGYDLSGKTIAPFITHGGGGLGRSVTDLKALCPSSTILDGLAVWGKNAQSAQNDVDAWLRRIGMKE
jgi:flavodoxin